MYSGQILSLAGCVVNCMQLCILYFNKMETKVSSLRKAKTHVLTVSRRLALRLPGAALELLIATLLFCVNATKAVGDISWSIKSSKVSYALLGWSSDDVLCKWHVLPQLVTRIEQWWGGKAAGAAAMRTVWIVAPSGKNVYCWTCTAD